MQTFDITWIHQHANTDTFEDTNADLDTNLYKHAYTDVLENTNGDLDTNSHSDPHRHTRSGPGLLRRL